MLKTPNLDEMAANGLRMDRFYASSPLCATTRATVLTGRTNDRTGVGLVGDALNKQERTLAQALQKAGYKTAHFGKWHLNIPENRRHPLDSSDPHNPGEFGFDYWLSNSGHGFNMDPELSLMGEPVQFRGDSSEVLVDQALRFFDANKADGQPLFIVIWFSSPHRGFQTYQKDTAAFDGRMSKLSAGYHGEIVALDRAVGTLRQGLRDRRIAEDTLLWFNSDNGGLPVDTVGSPHRITPDSTGHLRGFKSQMFEGGIRVPAIIEWPGTIAPRVSHFPAGTVDIFPTLIEVADLEPDSINVVNDGISISEVFNDEPAKRDKPLGFRVGDGLAWIDNDWKLVRLYPDAADHFRLFNLAGDPGETQDLIDEYPQIAARLLKELTAWEASIERSMQGADYPEGKVLPNGRPKTQYKNRLRRDDNWLDDEWPDVDSRSP